MPPDEMDMDVDTDTRAPANAPSDGTRDDTAAVRSIEGWIVFASGIHEEAQDDDVTDFFGEFGTVKNLVFPLDKRSGYRKGYALIAYATLAEAREAVDSAHGTKMLDRTLSVDFAFVRPPPQQGKEQKRGGRQRRSGGARARSRSPGDGKRQGGVDEDETVAGAQGRDFD